MLPRVVLVSMCLVHVAARIARVPTAVVMKIRAAVTQAGNVPARKSVRQNAARRQRVAQQKVAVTRTNGSRSVV